MNFTRRGALGLFLPAAPAIIGIARPSLAQMLTTGAGKKPAAAATGATWDPSAKSSLITLSNSNKTATDAATNDMSWNTVLANIGRSTGKKSFAIKITGGPASGSNIMPGFGTVKSGGAYGGTFPGNYATSVGFWNSGWIFGTGMTAGVTQTTGYSAVGQYWQVEVDLDAGKGWCCKDGTSYASSGSPSAGTNPSFTWTGGTTMFPSLGLQNDSTVNSVDILVGTDVPFTPSSGYSATW